MTSKRAAWLFFLALSLFYLSLSPGVVSGMGYMDENIKASGQIVSNIIDWLSLRGATTRVDWPRHGFIELVFEAPFLLVSRLFFGPSQEWAERILAIQPALATSLTCTLVFVWTRQITSSLTWAYLLGVATGLSTLLWPYAYIGLETTQSLFLLLAAYMALGPERKKTWPRTILFSLSCAVAVGVKLNGFFLAPAVGFLILCYFKGKDSGIASALVDNWKSIVVVLAIIGAIFLLNLYTRSIFFADKGGSLRYVAWLVKSPLMFALNVYSFFASPNKGLIVYSPIIILCLATLHRAFQVSPRIVIFALLTLGGLVGGFSLIRVWSEETWGPRYLHSSIAPLIICLALARKSVAFRFRKEIPLLALGVLGAAISLLGSFFFYGYLRTAAFKCSQSTIENLQYDINWNHIRFNLELLQIWVRSGNASNAEPVYWPPPPHWWFAPPSDAVAAKSVDLRSYATPQPLVVRELGISKPLSRHVVWAIYLICLLAGITLLIWLARAVSKADAKPDQSEPLKEAISEGTHIPT